MARITKGQKAERALKLLLALQNPRIVAKLQSRGFAQADQAEGVALLGALSSLHADASGQEPREGSLTQKLDAWENEWFPIAMATLQRRFPEVHAQLFKNLGMASGARVVVSVSTFVERYERLLQGDVSFGPQAAEAVQVLTQRGLTPAVLDQARALLTEFATLKPVPVALDAQQQQSAAVADAEQKLWAWYLEWSRIARAVITDRRDLRQLGFLQSQTTREPASDDEDDDVDTTTDDDPAVESAQAC